MNVGIYIGRFQPLHIGHITIMAYMQKKYDHIIVLVGSANQRASIKNPFSFEQRKQWLEQSFFDLVDDANSSQKISVLPLNDYRYNEKKWETGLVAQVASVTTDMDDVTLVGHEKDDSSYYLKSFPQWTYDSVAQSIKISATPIRTAWFEDRLADYAKFLPPYVQQYLSIKQPDYKDTFAEYAYLEAEKQKFANYPYPETLKLCCADAVLVCNDAILLIKRGDVIGKGSWALPGGYVNCGERFADGAMRELYEETQIDAKPEQIKLINSHMFDDPKRTFGFDRMTVGHYYTFKGNCPAVKGADDAAEAKWVKLSHIKNMKMFDDHADIIDHFLNIL